MTAKFELNDENVVVIIGTGAGGGTLANELAQKGVKNTGREKQRQHDRGHEQNRDERCSAPKFDVDHTNRPNHR